MPNIVIYENFFEEMSIVFVVGPDVFYEVPVEPFRAFLWTVVANFSVRANGSLNDPI